MRLLEYESKEILKKYGIPVPAGQVVTRSEDLQMQDPVVLKAQIPIGGRQKAGGIIEAEGREEARSGIEQLLSTEVRDYRPRKILVEEKIAVEHEFFTAITYDTVAKSPLAIFSREGGVDIEELAACKPEKVRREYFSARGRLPQYRAREIISDAGVSGKMLIGLGSVLSILADIFLDYDATLAEINPIALSDEGKLVALDCHLEIDDDAMFRHKEISKKQQDQDRYVGGRSSTDFERKAAEIDNLDHRGVAGRMIEFDGTLGLIIGGGGASLTAFDAVQQHGGDPANYCEIGGNPSVLKVQELTKHILSKPNVEKIAVIMNVVSNTRVDMVARGVVKGILESGKVPSETVAVFRVPGAWEEEGFKILSKYGVPYCDRTVSIDEAAKMAVERMKG
ncbi:MAG: acetate--CoA ligase family protein [Desulfobacteraceae bacterium]|jgi:succinyl-CoA synthetase beta subunit/citryl-CoA synthetase large subunit